MLRVQPEDPLHARRHGLLADSVAEQDRGLDQEPDLGCQAQVEAVGGRRAEAVLGAATLPRCAGLARYQPATSCAVTP